MKGLQKKKEEMSEKLNARFVPVHCEKHLVCIHATASVSGRESELSQIEGTRDGYLVLIEKLKLITHM